MNIYELTNKYSKENTPIIVISVVEKQGEGPAEVGGKLLLTINNEAFGTVGGGALEYTAREYCKELFQSKKSVTKTYLLNEGKVMKDVTTLPMACGGKVTLFFEYIGPSEYIYVFGAGHVGQALVNILKTLKYHITVIDERKDVINRFVGADELVEAPFASYVEENKMMEDSFVVVCTPSHKFDYSVINTIFEKKLQFKYVGMLCSERKLREFLDQTFKKHSRNLNLSNFYSPVGLDTGGGSPEEIAISIASEILAVSNNKQGHKHMREEHTDDSYRYW